MFDDIKQFIVGEFTNCPMCDHLVGPGEDMYKDEYRNETICQYCLEDYKKEIISIEGVDGRLLK